MSGLEALGVVANIFQVIGFAAETVRLCKAIYDGSGIDKHLEEYATTLKTLSSNVQSHYHTRQSRGPDERKLEDVARKCNVAARALDEEVRFIIGCQGQGKLAATIRTAAKATWRKNRLKRLEKSLAEYRDMLESHLLVRVW